MFFIPRFSKIIIIIFFFLIIIGSLTLITQAQDIMRNPSYRLGDSYLEVQKTIYPQNISLVKNEDGQEKQIGQAEIVDEYLISDIPENEFLEEYPYLKSGFQNLSIDIEVDQPIFDKEIFYHPLSLLDKTEFKLKSFLGIETQALPEYKLIKEINKSKNIQTNLDLSKISLATDYQELNTESFLSVKQSIILTNNSGQDLNFSLFLRNRIDADRIHWDGKEYSISEDPQKFENPDEISFYAKKGGFLFFYDHSDISDEFLPELWLNKQNSQSFLILSLNIFIPAFSSKTIDPTYGVEIAALDSYPQPEYVTAPENNTFKIGVQNYQAEFAENITDPNALQYKLGDKYIALTPAEIRVDGHRIKLAQNSRKQGKALYKNTFGDGIDIEILTEQRIWRKILKVDSLERLKDISTDAEFVEVVFELDTNFIIDGWDRHSDFEINGKIRLGDYSYIKPASAWDSYSEEICNYDPELEEDICETLTNRIQITTLLQKRGNKLYYIKKIPVDWLRNAQFPVYTDADINYGTAVQFESDTVHYVRVTELDTDKFVVCYREYVGTDGADCIVGIASGTSITFGTRAEFVDNIMATGRVGLAKMDTDKFIVGYAADLLDDDGYVRAGTANGTDTITYGAAVEFVDSDAEWIKGGGVGTDRAVFCFNDETDPDVDVGKCVVATTSGTTIGIGTPVDYSETDFYPGYNSVTQVDTDEFVSCFRQIDAPSDLVCYLGTVSENSITFNASTTVDPSGAIYSSLDSWGTNQFALTWYDGVSRMILATTSDTAITLGTAVEYETDRARVSVITNIDATHAVVAFMNLDSSPATSAGESQYVTFDWTNKSITTSTSETFESNVIAGDADEALGIDLISTNKVVICYQDDTDSDVGECIIGNITATPAVGTAILNEGNDITLTENTTTSVTATTTITDFNGHEDISSVEGKIYRSGVGSGCSADDNNCYSDSSCATSSCSGNSCVATCEYDVYFYADPTDAGDYSAQHWEAWIKAVDVNNASSSATSSGVEMNTLHALSLSADNISYGSLASGEDTGTLDQSQTITNTGNDSIDVYLYGTNMASSTSPSWYSSYWLYRRKITIDNTKVDDDLTDFPALVSTTSADLASKAQSDGDDILFTSSDGQTKLNHEIELYASSTGELVAWVKTNLSSSTDTTLYMYYGNSGASNQEQATSVWDSNYVGVWHLSEDGTGNRLDSTANVNTSTPSGYDGDEATTSGKIDGADWLDGTNDCMHVTTINIGAADESFTVEGWHRNPTTTYIDNTPFITNYPGSGHDGFFMLGSDDGEIMFWWIRDTSKSYSTKLGPYDPAFDDEWHYYVGIRDAINSTTEFYIDGAVAGTTTYPNNVAVKDATSYLSLGEHQNGNYIDGYVDEFRVSNTTRNAAWISTSYNNQTSTSDFMSFSSEESPLIPVGSQEYATSSGISYGSGTDATSSSNNAVEVDLTKPTSQPSTSTDDIYWGLGIPADTEDGVYTGSHTYETKSD